MSDSKTECPFISSTTSSTQGRRTNRDWWPNQLDLTILSQHSEKSDPMGIAFDYAREFETLDLDAVKKDLFALMTDSKAWWPACLLYTSPSPRDKRQSRMPSSA